MFKIFSSAPLFIYSRNVVLGINQSARESLIKKISFKSWKCMYNWDTCFSVIWWKKKQIGKTFRSISWFKSLHFGGFTYFILISYQSMQFAMYYWHRSEYKSSYLLYVLIFFFQVLDVCLGKVYYPVLPLEELQ